MFGNRSGAVFVVALCLTASCFADEKLNDAAKQDKPADQLIDSESSPTSSVENNTLVNRKDVETALLLPWPSIEIAAEPTLSDILADLSLFLSQTSQKPITFVVDHRELQLEAIHSLDEITVKDIDIHPGTHTCEQVLDLIWSQLDVELVGIPMQGHVLITSLQKADRMTESRFYDLTGLMLVEPLEENSAITETESQEVSNRRKRRAGRNKRGAVAEAGNPMPPKNPAVLKQFGGEGIGGAGLGCGTMANLGLAAGSNNPTHSIVELIQQQVTPDDWFENGGEYGQISAHGQYIAVRATYRTHRMIQHLLDNLREVVNIGGQPGDINPAVSPSQFNGGSGMFRVRPESVTK